MNTPGPWNAERNDLGNLAVWSDSGAHLLESESLSLEEREANAGLMAAAPDLLAALQDMLTEFGNQRFKVRRDFSKMVKVEAARQAIAKAKGDA